MPNPQIIGREAEQAILRQAFKSRKAEFIATYGRRRVGKTFLIEQFFTSQACLYFSITGLHNGTLKEQLAIFTNALQQLFFTGTGLRVTPPNDWMQAFEQLTNTINKFSKQKKMVLFFDELPWLASQKSGFKKALDHYWNTVWSKNHRFVLIVCGSAASWMIENIIHDKGGLHNRITVQLPLFPFSLKETYEYLHHIGAKFNHQQVLELYMVLGGIPHYLEKVNPKLSAAQNISHLCFSRHGRLFGEFDKLFASLFKNADAYIELVKIIASKRYGVTRKLLETHAKLSATGGTLSNRLNALEEAGFIKSFIPIGYNEKGLYYRLTDEYCLFYLTWIKPVKRQIEHESTPNYWAKKSKSPSWHSWSGYAFESICLKHVSQLKRALFIPDNALAGAWQYRADNEGAQIDLLFDRDDGVVTLCEIKYCQTEFEINKKYAAELAKKISVFQQHSKINKQVFLSMITATPLKQNQYSAELVTSTALLEDLFN